MKFKYVGEDRVESTHWAVELVDLGEGWSGEYNPDDPDDEPLLRFDIYSRENSKVDWQEPQDSSYCTQINSEKITKKQKRELLKYLLEQVYYEDFDTSVKKLCERLSWIELDWLKK